MGRSFKVATDKGTASGDLGAWFPGIKILKFILKWSRKEKHKSVIHVRNEAGRACIPVSIIDL